MTTITLPNFNPILEKRANYTHTDTQSGISIQESRTPVVDDDLDLLLLNTLTYSKAPGVIEATVRGVLAELRDKLSLRLTDQFIPIETYEHVPPKSVRIVTLRVANMGKGRPLATFDFSERILDEE